MARKKKKSKKWLWLSLLVILAAVISFSVYKSNKKEIPKVTIAKSSINNINELVSGSGKIFPQKEIKISSDVSGEIVELYVLEGDSVVAGQILAKIDPESYLSAVERGKASLNNSKAQKSISLSQVEASKAQKEQIIAQLSNTKTIHNRNVKLLQEGVISQADFDNSAASLEALQANIRASQSNINSAQERAKAAEFTIKSAHASLKELQTSLSRTTIKAPVSGIVSLLNVEQGERVVGTIQMAGTEMMRIANLNSMEVQVEISENNILKVNLNDTVNIEVDAYLDRIFKGTVVEIANTASNATSSKSQAALLSSTAVTNFIVKISIDPNSYQDIISKSKYAFRPGMSATVDIFTKRVENIITVPIQAVTAREKEINGVDVVNEVVFVKNADTLQMIKVSTGIQDDDNIEILNGLDTGFTVVTGPYSILSKDLQEGDKVEIQKKNKDKNKK